MHDKMNITTSQITTCMHTWLQCEELLVSLAEKKKSFSARTTRILDECAHICFGALQTLKSPGKNLQHVALLCVGICEECAEICERYSDRSFKEFAIACRQCSEVLTPIAGSDL